MKIIDCSEKGCDSSKGNESFEEWFNGFWLREVLVIGYDSLKVFNYCLCWVGIDMKFCKVF